MGGVFAIRDYKSEDLSEVTRIVEAGDSVAPGLVRERMENWHSFVWEEAGVIKGVACYNREDEGELNVRVYVAPDSRNRGIGGSLYYKAISRVKDLGHGRVTARYRADKGGGRTFFHKRGFTYWYDMEFLKYEGPRMPLPESSVEIRLYEERDFEDYLRVMAEAFLPQRRFFDFRPHDVRELHGGDQGGRDFWENRDNMITALDGGRLVGIAELEGAAIDSVAVDLSARGRGIGRDLMRYCVNLLMDRGHKRIETSVVRGNIPAWRLYNSLGFERVQVDEWSCIWI